MANRIELEDIHVEGPIIGISLGPNTNASVKRYRFVGPPNGVAFVQRDPVDLIQRIPIPDGLTREDIEIAVRIALQNTRTESISRISRVGRWMKLGSSATELATRIVDFVHKWRGDGP